jgi:hypothetical protein
MMKKHPLLVLDSVINLILGALLLVFPNALVEFLGIPGAASAFYPSLLGAVLFGIGIALLIAVYFPGAGGLGTGGAVAINLSAGLVLAMWMLMGDLNIPAKGYAFLWVLVLILVVLSTVEIYSSMNRGNQ